MLSGKYPHSGYNNIFEFKEKLIENRIDYSLIKDEDAKEVL